MTEVYSRLWARFSEFIYSDAAQRCVSSLERGVFVAVGLIALRSLWSEGLGGLLRDFVLFLRRLPLINSLIDTILDGEVSGAMKLLAGQGDSDGNAAALLPIPETGVSPSEVIKVLEALKASETAAEEGKAFAYTYTTKHDMAEFAKSLGKAYELFTPKSQSGDADHEFMLTQAWDLFMHSNALNPMMYPSLRRMETEVISMAAWMVRKCRSDESHDPPTSTSTGL
jgi:sphinganine-1-phosphate aldolase